VLFGASSTAPNPGTFSNGGAPGHDLTNQDQEPQSLVSFGLPISKSGAPFFPPPPQLSNPYDQALVAARLVAPNLVDYFTKPLPPLPLFPSAPGKIPSGDFNPYAGGAILDALNLAVAGASLGAEAAPFTLARMASEAAPGTILKAVGASQVGPTFERNALQRLNAAVGLQENEAGAASALRPVANTAAASGWARDRAGDAIIIGPYNALRGQLAEGWQANHLNQSSVYQDIIPRREGLSLGMRGNIITEPGTPHYNFHRALEQFWDQYRPGGDLEWTKPTNAEYGKAIRQAMIAAGLTSARASEVAARAAAERAARGLIDSDPVPRIPTAIWRRRRD